MANKTADNRKITLEKTVKLLVEVLKSNGYTLRKEELKRGFGWKVVSGSCRIHEDRVIFMDRKMSAEDQVAFLSGYVHTAAPGFEMPAQILQQLTDLGWSGAAKDSGSEITAEIATAGAI